MLCSNPFSSPGPCQSGVLPATRHCEYIWLQRHANGRGFWSTSDHILVTSDHVLVRWHANGRGCACTSTGFRRPPFTWLVYLLLWPMCTMVKKVLDLSHHPDRGDCCCCLDHGLGPHCRSTKWQRRTGLWRMKYLRGWGVLYKSTGKESK